MYRILTLRLGELYLAEGSGVVRDPIHAWLVQSDGVNILVDSGMPDIDVVRATLKVGGTGGGHASLIRSLAAAGITPADVDYVILTHAHFDHASNLDLFPNACVVLQRDELFHAIDPVPSQRIYYSRDVLAQVMARKRPRELRLIDGDCDFLPGIRILKVPSHTDGMQVPIVTTAAGRAALVSDLGDHYRYWYPADPRANRTPKRYLSDSFMCGPIRSASERDWLSAMRRVLDHADIVVPAHDFRIPKRMPQEWFTIPQSHDGDLAHTPPDGYADMEARQA